MSKNSFCLLQCIDAMSKFVLQGPVAGAAITPSSLIPLRYAMKNLFAFHVGKPADQGNIVNVEGHYDAEAQVWIGNTDATASNTSTVTEIKYYTNPGGVYDGKQADSDTENA